VVATGGDVAQRDSGFFGPIFAEEDRLRPTDLLIKASNNMQRFLTLYVISLGCGLHVFLEAYPTQSLLKGRYL
jgi:hypothetical protein